MSAVVISTAAIVLALAMACALAMVWRLYTDSMRRTDATMQLVEQERARSATHQAALRRYEVAFASISGRGELGEQVLVETARALGLREGLHFTVQTDLAGGGAARPDLVLMVGDGRRVPVDAKTSLAVWLEAVETDDAAERADALRVHARNIRSRATELAGKEYQRWADAIYGAIMFVPSDAAVVAALDTDPHLLRWLLDRRVFLCGPTGFGVLASAALFAATEHALAEDVEQVRRQAATAHRSAGAAIDAVNLSSTHLQRFLSARRRELDALESFRTATEPLREAAASPTEVAAVRRDETVAALLPADRQTTTELSAEQPTAEGERVMNRD
ncbi:DNA recombination protein RmuC [Actinoalloteichus hymeniacidonis]|uniref:RmuC family n=1 Tax=Actinoalloteichus hymeniacidonis TaxID=340345 RepID=A0AAC9HM49_9PSEU|nr:DNA recombination protein RmuC [Actinoalloteichus hymeniacidonis]AOS61674.1 RmuC family [Actinoalloteichus hymeniacidonis]MBB5910312.1 DNA recombination protein RmuC [Actinoalloteichus hymeniacidonis]